MVGNPYNWGYDPWHYQAVEGSFCSSLASAEGSGRVHEFRTMIGALHAMGLRVVLDQVFNHTASFGQNTKSVLDRTVPGYYHRLDPLGFTEHSTCCPNVATEHAMAQKLMVDSVVLWARDYKVDGFRFDLAATLTEGPGYRGTAGAFIANRQLHMVLFVAADPHYFDRNRAAAEGVIASARL